MEEHRDVVVIGAGIGGLTAAALLVKEGLDVLVLDGTTHPGGTAYIYTRRGYTFPMGPLGFSNPELVADMLRKAGVEEELEYHRVHYRLHAFGQRINLSLPYRELAQELIILYPSEAKGIQRFFEDMRTLAAATRSNSTKGVGDVAGEFLKTSAASYLDDLIGDWRLRRILGSMGTRKPYAGLPLLAAMWELLCEKGIHYPRGGMRILCDALAAAIDGPGENGVLRLGTEVKEIGVDGGRASGVVLGDGNFIGADAIICNADFKATFLRLLPPGSIPGDLRSAVAGAPQAASNLQVCLGLDSSKLDLCTFADGSRIIHRGDRDPEPGTGERPDWSAAEVDPASLAGDELEIGLLSRDDPALAPRGGAVLVIRVAADHRHFKAFRPQWKKRSPVYKAYKDRLAKALIGEASKLIPGLEDAIEVQDVATPLTFEERGGRSEGAVAGWSWDYMPGDRLMTRELVLTPIAGLYMAGYQAFSRLDLGGVPSAMLSGTRAARYLLRGAGPAEDMGIPGHPPT